MHRKLTLGMLFCIPATIISVGCSEIPTSESKTQVMEPAMVDSAEYIENPGGLVVLRNLHRVQSLDGSETRMTLEVDWVEQDHGSRRIIIDGPTGSSGKKDVALYDMDWNLQWRMGWETIGADFHIFEESASERLDTIMAEGPDHHWQETYTHTVGEQVRKLVLAYDAGSPQDRADARREFLGFMPDNSTLDPNPEGERLVFLLQDTEFHAAVQRANGEDPSSFPEPADGIDEAFELACELLRQCTSTACADDASSPACMICATGTFICWIFGQ